MILSYYLVYLVVVFSGIRNNFFEFCWRYFGKCVTAVKVKDVLPRVFVYRIRNKKIIPPFFSSIRNCFPGVPHIARISSMVNPRVWLSPHLRLFMSLALRSLALRLCKQPPKVRAKAAASKTLVTPSRAYSVTWWAYRLACHSGHHFHHLAAVVSGRHGP